MLSTKKVLIAGASGMVGTNLQTELDKLNISSVPTKCKSTLKEHDSYLLYNFKDYRQCLNATKGIDTMVLLAGCYHGSNIRGMQANDVVFDNMKILGGLLSAAAFNSVSQIILVSSATVYQDLGQPFVEDILDLNISPPPEYAGVATMFRYIEKIAKVYSLECKSRLVIFRPTNIYGPWDNFDSDKSKIIPAIIRKTHNKPRKISLTRATKVTRDFVFVKDFVNDIVDEIVGEVFINREVYNIGSGSAGMTIQEIAERIFSIQKIPFLYMNWIDNGDDNRSYRVNNIDKYLRIKSLGGITPLSTGLRETIQWYRERHNTV